MRALFLGSRRAARGVPRPGPLGTSSRQSKRPWRSRERRIGLDRRFFASRAGAAALSEARRREVAFSQSWNCAACGSMLRPDFQIDHVVPVAMGGHSGAQNLQALCLTCHKLKTQGDVREIRRSKKLYFDSRHVASTAHNNSSNDFTSPPPLPATYLPSQSLDAALHNMNENQRRAVLHPPADAHGAVATSPSPLLLSNDSAAAGSANSKHVRVVAGPGTGKTAVLTARVATLVERFGVLPKQILTLTFTNRAAQEMRSRIVDLVVSPGAGEQISMGTFHATCLGLLRENIDQVRVRPTPRAELEEGERPPLQRVLGVDVTESTENALVCPYRRGFGVYDETESLKVIRDIMKKTLGWSGERASPAEFQARISSAKNQGISDAHGYYGWEGASKDVARVFAMYETTMRRRNQIDFDDMLWLTVRLLKDRPSFRMACQSQWTTILVDEFQDTNGMQFEFLRLLATRDGMSCPGTGDSGSGHEDAVAIDGCDSLEDDGSALVSSPPQPSSLFVVGDENQAIYAFRGADAENQNRFDDTFQPHVYELNQNYRSVQGILDAAHRLISANYEENQVEEDDRELNLDFKSLTVSSCGGSRRSYPLVGLAQEPSTSSSVMVCQTDDEKEEAAWIVDECLRLQELYEQHRANTTSESGNESNAASSSPPLSTVSASTKHDDTPELAVLTRTNAQFRIIERELLLQGVDHIVVNGTRFFDRREVRDLVAYVKFLHNPKSSCLSLERIINVPPRQIGSKTVQALQVAAISSGYSMWEVLCAATQNLRSREQGQDGGLGGWGQPSGALDPALEQAARGVPARALKKLHGFRDMIERLQSRKLSVSSSREARVSDVVLAVLTESGYDQWIRFDNPQGEDRWGNVRELVNFASGSADLEAWLDDVALMSDPQAVVSRGGDDVGVGGRLPIGPVKLMTVHASKGSEFDVVFLAGVEESLLPHHYSLVEGEAEIAEERRLCYVALTRAKRRVYLTFARNRMLMGKRREVRSSRFLNELDEDDVLWRHAGGL